MHSASPFRAILKSALTDQMQNLLLIDTVILLRGSMNQLKQKIVDIEINGLPHCPQTAQFLIQLVHGLVNAQFIILFNRRDKVVKFCLAQKNAVAVDMDLLFIIIYIFPVMKRLKRVEHTGCAIGF